jgi:predicted transcriptional regulator
MKVLEEHHLIVHYDDTYELTTIGKLIVDKMAPLVSITQALDIDIEYWGTHNLEFIPSHLLERISELPNFKVLNPTVVEMFEINNDFVESTIKSRSISLISTIMHPSFPSLLSSFIKGNKNVLMIITETVFSKLKEDHYEGFKELISHGGVKIYVCQHNLKMTSLSISDSCFILRLLSKNNLFSNKQLLCNDPRSYQWSKDLFDYYVNKSTPITEI